MAFFSLVVPPTVFFIALVLVIISLVSPAPFHSSSVSLIYISPVTVSSNNGSSSEALAMKQTDSSGSMSSSLGRLLSKSDSLSSSGIPASTVSSSRPQISDPDSFSAARSLYNIPDANSLSYSSDSDRAEPDLSSFSSMTTLDQASLSDSISVSLPSQYNPFPTSSASSTIHVQRREVSAETSIMATSNLQFSIGFLGSCFTDVKGTRQCTSSGLHPHYNLTGLSTLQGLEIDTSGLPTTLHAEPILILLCVLALVLCSVVHVRRVHRVATKDTCTLPTRRQLLALRIITYVQDVASVVLFLVTVYLRIQISHADDAFNSSNGQRALTNAQLSSTGQLATPLVLNANAGTAFSCICVAATALFILARWERRQLRREDPLDNDELANDHEPGRWSRFLREPLNTTMQRPSQPVTISAPLPIYTPDHVPNKHEAWMTTQGRKIQPFPVEP
ncbi:hypothetical protein MPSI1_002855 [Malassezia psittaci]|uniref:Uncharacterized protein n=1 Tax=Malassezia psittaci TaxID=1821823 RepID=A0AAF0JF96_9BASI|nr:hypothetical protein MPSI1_002855 [Malassezia psittaci]